MEGLHCLKFILEHDDLLYKIDLKDPYSSAPFSKNSQNFVRFHWQVTHRNFFAYVLDLGQLKELLQND